MARTSSSAPCSIIRWKRCPIRRGQPVAIGLEDQKIGVCGGDQRRRRFGLPTDDAAPGGGQHLPCALDADGVLQVDAGAGRGVQPGDHLRQPVGRGTQGVGGGATCGGVGGIAASPCVSVFR